MQKAYLTGLTGTVAPFLITALKARQYHQVGSHIRIETEGDIPKSLNDIAFHQPDIIFHLGLAPVEWAEALAKYSFDHHIKFVYISTASVFDDNAAGPYTIETPVLAKSGYPLYKYQCEQAVQKANPDAYVLRIGWQIDPNQRTDTNNMFRFFAEQIKQHGKIMVSNRFYPSASFLPETTEAITDIVLKNRSGIYHINGNPGLSLFAIAEKINQHYQKGWLIENNSEFHRNDLLLDPRIRIKFFDNDYFSI